MAVLLCIEDDFTPAEVKLLFWLFFLSSFVLTAVGYTIIVQFLRKYLSKENFRGRRTPTGSGFIMLISFLFVVSFFIFFREQNMVPLRDWLLPLTILVMALGLLGFVDDLFGQRGVGGFKGHFGELLKGNITTGAIKALGGGVVCLIVARFFSESLVALIVNGLLMALFANIFNLLDLRPGRALKLFLILGIVVFLFSFRSAFWTLSGIFLGIFIILLWADLSESCMLGDVGSNILGGVIGFSMVVNFNWLINAFILFLISLIQIYAESHSITEFIENTAVLRKLDEFGRRREQRKVSKKQQRIIL